MTPDEPKDPHPIDLDREQIIALLTELGDDLSRSGVRGELFVVGGAAMALAFNARRLTSDVDAVFEPKTTIYAAARLIADRHGLAPDWLNDGVKGLLPGPDPSPREIVEIEGISVSVPSPRYLLALKVAAARVDRDLDDIALLAGECGVSTAAEILDIAESVMGPGRLTPKSLFTVQEMFPAANALRGRLRSAVTNLRHRRRDRSNARPRGYGRER